MIQIDGPEAMVLGVLVVRGVIAVIEDWINMFRRIRAEREARKGLPRGRLD